MNAWRLLKDQPITTRIAEPSDRAALSALLSGTWRRHGHASIEDQATLLANGTSVIAFSGPDAIGFLGLEMRSPASWNGDTPEVWADVQLAAAESGLRDTTMFRGFLETVRPALRAAGCTGVVCLSAPGWLLDWLGRAGFNEADQVLTYTLNDRRILREHEQKAPEGPAQLRVARTSDADTIFRLNELAFTPLWRYDDRVIMGWLMTSERAVIAEAGGHPVGFSLTTEGLGGNYCHLIRVAIDPAYQGKGIGRQLVADSVRFAASTQSPGLALNTQASNMVSRSLYESLGFRQTGHMLAVLTTRIK